MGNRNNFIALLSSSSIAKRGLVQKELKNAFEVQEGIPESDIYLIPVRLDDCKKSDFRLSRIQYIDLFPDWNEGFKRILEAMNVDATQQLREQQPILPDKVKKQLENSLVNREIKKERKKRRWKILKILVPIVIVIVVIVVISFIILPHPSPSPEYSFITKWGSFGSSKGQFYRPESVAIDSSGIAAYRFRR